jgi:hypothetical protein
MKTLLSAFLFFILMITCHYGMTQVQVTVIQNQTSCVLPNGSASASVAGGNTGYTFEWFDVTLNPLGISSSIATNLPAGNYSVIVRDATAAVVGIGQVVIQSEIVVPAVTLESIPNTSCSVAANGALVTSVPGSPTDYSYAWYEGAEVQGSLISTATHLFDRSGGDYTVVVTNIITGCSTTVTGQITDAPAIPIVNVVATNNTNCTTPNGSLNAVTEQAAAQYSITWYDVGLNPLGITGPFADNLAAGNYVVIVTDGLTGCNSLVHAPAIYDECDFMFSGSSSVAGNVVTNDKKATGGIGYYPNPASGTLYVGSTGPAALALINHSGEIVLRQNVYLTDTPFALDISGLKSGKYILKANQSGVVTNYQIIIKK